MKSYTFLSLVLALASSPVAFAQNVGKLSLDKWDGLTNSYSVISLQREGISKRLPDSFSEVNGASIDSLGDSYGARLRGTVTAPVTGYYSFFISGDNGTALYLSEAATPFAKKQIAYSTYHSAKDQWDKYTTQKSSPILLQAGQEYYIEGQVKEATWADHLSIGWAYEADSAVTYTDLAIGDNVTQSFTENADGSVDLSVEAGDIWGTSDRFAFRYRTWTGDGEVVAKISDMNNPHNWAKVGLMMRASLAADSAYGMMDRTGGNQMSFQRRVSTGASSSHTAYGTYKDWVKLVRKGNKISGYVSDDGKKWTYVSEQDYTTLPATLYVGIAATDNPSSNPVTATVSELRVSPLTATEVIPSTALKSYAGVDDANLNGLSDAWETEKGILQDASSDLSSGKFGEYGDFDFDGIDNRTEFTLGLDPADRAVLAGQLVHERWTYHGGTKIADMTASNYFKRTPDIVEFTANVNTNTIGDSYGSRYKGNVVAPKTGEYTFWIAGDDEAELWFADGSVNPTGATLGHTNAYGKKKIASVKDERFGRNWTVDEDYDRYATQRSVSVYLEEGESYYFEVLHKEAAWGDHVSVVWQVPGEARVLIPSSAFTTYLPDLDDLDADNLPDAWESANGLDSNNNGYGNNTQGEYGDLDGDGLSNLLEYQLGTQPNNTDSDGDGQSDYAEHTYYGTDPNQSNTLAPQLLTEMTLGNYQAATGDWYTRADGSIISATRRGIITYPFSTTESGIYEVQLVVSPIGNTAGLKKLPLEFEIDGEEFASGRFDSTNGEVLTITKITPFLKSGDHTLGIRSLNYLADLSLKIHSVKVFRIGGTDANGDGIADWAQQRLAGDSYMMRFADESYTSPTFIEGRTSTFGNLSLSTLNASGSPVAQTPLRSVNSDFYANIDLDPVTPTDITVSFENGAKVEQKQVTWKALNLLMGTDIAIRKGDSLLLAGWQGATFSGTFQLTIDGTLVQDGVGNSVLSTPQVTNFATAGEHAVAVTWTSADGTLVLSNTYTIKVREADFGDDFIVLNYNRRIWETPDIANDFSVIADASLAWNEVTQGSRTVESLVNWTRFSNVQTSQSSTLIHPSGNPSSTSAVDGNTDGHYFSNSVTHTKNIANSWWQVDFGQQRPIEQIVLYNRTDCCQNRLSNFKVTVFDDQGNEVSSQSFYQGSGNVGLSETWTLTTPVYGSVVKVELLGLNNAGNGILSLTEVEVLGMGFGQRAFEVSAYDAKDHYVVARMPGSGVIIARGTVKSFDIAETNRTKDASVVQTYDDGTSLMAYTIVVDNLPAGATLTINTLFQGVTFLDGSNTLILTAADFDEHGIATIYMESASLLKMCHYLDVTLNVE